MALSQRLEIRQSQALVMTPQLLQAIKLLQLSSLDLAAYVEGELERNPLLERAETDAPIAESAPEPQVGGDAQAADWAGDELETSRTAIEEGLGTELGNVFDDDGADKAAAPARLFAMVWRGQWERGGIRPRSFCLDRTHAGRSSHRSVGTRSHRSG